MTSCTPPPLPSHRLASTPSQDPGETSLDLADVPESERYPSILTRLDSSSSYYAARVEAAAESPASFSRDHHRQKGDILGIEAESDRARHQENNHPEVMASKHQSEHQSRSPPTHHQDEDDDVIDNEGEGQSDADEVPGQTGTQQKDTPERSKSPAYVAPIPRIGSIPQVSPGIQISADRPELPPFVGALLIGKLVDEDGDIVDEKTGQVLAHAAGDLPTMVGRRVSNAQGDILGDDGELLGYIADIEWPKARPPPTAPPQSLFDLMGRATSSLMVDHTGNILDASGNVVGTFHDNNNPLHRKEKEEKEARERTQGEPKERSEQQQQSPGEEKDQQKRSPPPRPTPPPQQQGEQEGQEQQQSQPQSTPGEGQPKPRRTEEERKENAAAWRKENPNESPSDIFLDVKSTREGIQLVIRIPTVFNGQQTTPHISFS